MKIILLAGVAAIIIILAAFALFTWRSDSGPGVIGEVHEHADFKVYLNDGQYDFSAEKYHSRENRPLSNFIHLHDLKGNIIHKHATGIKLGFFFRTLGMKLNSTCFVLDDGTEYCNDGSKTLKMYVNGARVQNPAEYELWDSDRILITYGSETEEEIAAQMATVTDEACIYSEKCPERGEPPDEATCVGSSNCIPEEVT